METSHVVPHEALRASWRAETARLKWTQSRLAREAGITQGAVSKILKGYGKVRARNVAAIEAALLRGIDAAARERLDSIGPLIVRHPDILGNLAAEINPDGIVLPEHVMKLLRRLLGLRIPGDE